MYILRSVAVLAIVLLSTLAINTQKLFAEEETECGAFSCGAEADIVSRYVWHGLAWSEGTALQPTVWASLNSCKFEAWGNTVLNTEPNQGKMNELDLTLSCEKEFKGVGIESSLEYYTYPNQDSSVSPDTAQFVLKLSHPLNIFSVYLANSFDIIKYSGAYFGELGLQFEKKINDKTAVESGVYLGYGSDKFNQTYAGATDPKGSLNVAGLNLSCTINLSDRLYVGPHVEYSTLIESDLRNAASSPDITVTGVAIGMEF